MERHKDERKVRGGGGLDEDEDAMSVATTTEAATAESIADSLAEVEINVEDEEADKADLSAIKEEEVQGKICNYAPN